MIFVLPVLFSFTLASKINFDLGAGQFFKTVCAPSHPTSLSGQSDYVCTLKERDFYPESIVKTVHGLKLMTGADMVKDLQLVLAKNLLKLKRKTPEEFDVYKTKIGQEYENFLQNLIAGVFEAGEFDFGFELFEELDLSSNFLINRATPAKLVERLAQIKPNLAVKLFENFLSPSQKIKAVLNDKTGTVFNEFSRLIKAPDTNLNYAFNDLSAHLCQKVNTRESPNISSIFDHFEAKEANILKAIYEICYGKDEEKAFSLYKQFKDIEHVKEAALMSNNYKTTLTVLKHENNTEILNLFTNDQVEKVLSLLNGQVSSDLNENLRILIENALESSDFEAGEILVKAVSGLKSKIQVNLHLKGLGKIYINPQVKNAILSHSENIKIKFTPISLAALIKDDHLFTFIKEFGNQKFFDTFEFDRPDLLLIYLNRPEDFDAAYKLYKLKQGDDLDELDFFADNLNTAFEFFKHVTSDSKTFLIMRRAQIEHLINKFKADFLPKLPESFSEAFKLTQEL